MPSTDTAPSPAIIDRFDTAGDTASFDTASTDEASLDIASLDTHGPSELELLDTDLPDLDEAAPTSDLVRTYLNEIGRTPLLTAEQEVELAQRIEAGLYAAELLRRHRDGEEPVDARRRCDHADLKDLEVVAADGAAAKGQMLRANLRLVVSVAKKYSHRGVPFLDVVQEGNLGLIRAVEKFDYRKGFKFSTYAMWWVRQAIGRGMAEQARTIRLPVHVSEEVQKVLRVQRSLSQDLGRDPTDAEVGERAGLDAERVAELRRVARDPVSLDAPVGADGDTRLGDLVLEESSPSASEEVEQAALSGEIDRLLHLLPERERTIVRLRFGLHDGKPRTLDEVGKQVGLTRERVRQLEKESLARLRHPKASERLLDWAS